MNDDSTSNFARTAAWLLAAGKQPGNEAQLSVQIGVHLEEISEFLDTLNLESATGVTSYACQELNAILKAIAHNIKMQNVVARIYDREAALDALSDCDVTGNGVAFLAGFNKTEADRRVLASNESKLDVNGQAIILPGGKVGKSASYVAPDLTGLY